MIATVYKRPTTDEVPGEFRILHVVDSIDDLPPIQPFVGEITIYDVTTQEKIGKVMSSGRKSIRTEVYSGTLSKG